MAAKLTASRSCPKGSVTKSAAIFQGDEWVRPIGCGYKNKMALAPVLRLGVAGGVCYYSVKAGVWSDGRNPEVPYLGLLASKRRVQDETNLIKIPVRTGKLKGGRRGGRSKA